MKKLTEVVLKSTKCSSALQSKQNYAVNEPKEGTHSKNNQRNATYTHNPNLHTSHISHNSFSDTLRNRILVDLGDGWSDTHDLIYIQLTLCIFVWANSHHFVLNLKQSSVSPLWTCSTVQSSSSFHMCNINHNHNLSYSFSSSSCGRLHL